MKISVPISKKSIILQDHLFYDIESKHGFVIEILLHMKKIIDHEPSMKSFLNNSLYSSYLNKGVDEPATFADRILEIIRTPNIKVCSVNEKSQTLQNIISYLHQTLSSS